MEEPTGGLVFAFGARGGTRRPYVIHDNDFTRAKQPVLADSATTDVSVSS